MKLPRSTPRPTHPLLVGLLLAVSTLAGCSNKNRPTDQSTSASTTSPSSPSNSDSVHQPNLPPVVSSPEISEVSDALREQLVSELTTGLLGDVVRMRLDNGSFSGAKPYQYLRRVFPQENEKDFGPFQIDTQRLRKNLQAHARRTSTSLESSRSELRASVEKIKSLLREFKTLIEKENGVTVRGELRRAQEIFDALDSRSIQSESR
jgi:hypothetical protein